MIICINTDASFNLKKGVGTYAYWIVSNLGRLKGSGALRHEVCDPSDAEMKAVCNAMAVISKHPELVSKVRKIVVNTDSMNTIHVFTNDVESMRRYGVNKNKYKAVRKKYHYIRTKHFKDVEFVFAHVKAHSGVQDKRSFVNEWLDEHAKKEMKKLLEIKDKEI